MRPCTFIVLEGPVPSPGKELDARRFVDESDTVEDRRVLSWAGTPVAKATLTWFQPRL